jgi:hypothetical protein
MPKDVRLIDDEDYVLEPSFDFLQHLVLHHVEDVVVVAHDHVDVRNRLQRGLVRADAEPLARALQLADMHDSVQDELASSLAVSFVVRARFGLDAHEAERREGIAWQRRLALGAHRLLRDYVHRADFLAGCFSNLPQRVDDHRVLALLRCEEQELLLPLHGVIKEDRQRRDRLPDSSRRLGDHHLPVLGGGAHVLHELALAVPDFFVREQRKRIVLRLRGWRWRALPFRALRVPARLADARLGCAPAVGLQQRLAERAEHAGGHRGERWRKRIKHYGGDG